jgi:hypothetical protein
MDTLMQSMSLLGRRIYLISDRGQCCQPDTVARWRGAAFERNSPFLIDDVTRSSSGSVLQLSI